MKIKALDMSRAICPICGIGMIREEDEVKCPKCGYASPIIVVNHRVGYEQRNEQIYRSKD